MLVAVCRSSDVFEQDRDVAKRLAYEFHEREYTSRLTRKGDTRLPPPLSAGPRLLKRPLPMPRNAWQLFFHRFPSLNKQFKEFLIRHDLEDTIKNLTVTCILADHRSQLRSALSSIQTVWHDFKNDRCSPPSALS